LASEHPNAGSAYGFVAAILGPRAGLVAGWTLLGTYLCFAIVGLGAFGLFGANLLQRMDLWRDASSFSLTMLAAVVVGPLSIIPARRAGLVLIILEGVAVVAMLLMACAVLLLVAQGHGPQGDPPLRPLHRRPWERVDRSGCRSVFSFAGFEGRPWARKSASRLPSPGLDQDRARRGLVFTIVTAENGLTGPAEVALHHVTSCWRIFRRCSAAGRRIWTRSPSAPLWEAHWLRSWHIAHSFCAAGSPTVRPRRAVSGSGTPTTPPSVSSAIVG
jgi:hypothetical protein